MDRETQKLVSLTAADIDRIVFNFYFDPGRNTPATECSFDGVSGIRLLETKGFHLEKLPGIPACVISGKFEIRLKGSDKYLSFRLLCNDIVESDNGDSYRLTKSLGPSACKEVKTP